MGTEGLTDRIDTTKVREYTAEAVVAVCLVGAGIAILGGGLLVLAGAIPAAINAVPELIEYITLVLDGGLTPVELMKDGVAAILWGLNGIGIVAIFVLLYKIKFE